MRQQNVFLFSTLLIGLVVLFSACEQEMIKEQLDIYIPETEEAQYMYIDEAGDMKQLALEGSVLSYEKNGIEQSVDLIEVEARRALLDISRNAASNTVSSITGSLKNDFRGRLVISYTNGRGNVVWQMREDLTFWGEVECLNQVRDQLILQIRITRSTAGDPFAVGQSVVTTLRDNGTPDFKNGVYDQIAKVMLIYAREDECMNRFLPGVNDLIGYDNSTGNIDTK